MLAAKQIWPLLKQTVTDWLEDKAPKLAASLALYTMLSIGPLMVIVLKVIGVVFRDEAQQGKVQQSLSGALPGGAAQFVEQAAQKAGQHGEGVWATIISTVLLLFAATGVFGELQDSMNTIWEVKPKPNRGIWGFIQQRFLSLAMVLGLAFLFMVSTVGTTAVAMVSGAIVGENKAVAFIVATLASLVVMTVLFAMIFKLLPDVQIGWKDVFLGAALTAVLYEIGKALLSWYLAKQTSGESSVYGAAGSLAALLLYIYYSAQILFFGAEFTQVYAREYGSGIRPSPHAEPMTAEARRQQGMEPKSASPTGPASGQPQRRPQPQFAHGDRRVVTIEQPAVMNRQGYLLAAGGVAAGLLVGAAGVLTGRKYGEPRIRAEQIDQRIKAIEARVGQKSRELKRFSRDADLAERVGRIEKSVTEATSRVRKHALKDEWYNRIKSYVG